MRIVQRVGQAVGKVHRQEHRELLRQESERLDSLVRRQERGCVLQVGQTRIDRPPAPIRGIAGLT
jgi:hypothetical protein